MYSTGRKLVFISFPMILTTWQDTHQVWRGKRLKCPLANEKFCQIMCHPDTLEIFCSYFMCRVNIPGVDHYWNKDPSEVVFLFQLWPCSVGVAPSKAYPNFKKQGQPFCKMKWHAHHTVIWRVFRFKKCSSHYNVPSKTALNLMSTCSNMFQFPQSWYFLLMPLGTLILNHKNCRSQVTNGESQVHTFRFTIGHRLHKQSVYLGWQNLKLYRFRTCCNNLRHSCIYQCLRLFFFIAFTSNCCRIIRCARRNW
jgi:hypothetical protein